MRCGTIFQIQSKQSITSPHIQTLFIIIQSHTIYRIIHPLIFYVVSLGLLRGFSQQLQTSISCSHKQRIFTIFQYIIYTPVAINGIGLAIIIHFFYDTTVFLTNIKFIRICCRTADT